MTGSASRKKMLVKALGLVKIGEHKNLECWNYSMGKRVSRCALSAETSASISSFVVSGLKLTRSTPAAVFFVKAHRAVDVAQLPTMTGGACRDADTLRAELRDDICRRVADERDRQDVRRGPVADADDAVEREELFLGVGLDGGDVGELFIEMVGAQLDRLGKACDLARGLCAGAQAALLPAAKDQRFGRADALAQIQAADTLGRAELVRADGDEVRAQRVGAERNFQKGLHRVGVQQGTGLFRFQKLRDLGHGEDAARLVVDEHHRDERGVVAQCTFDLRGGDVAVLVGL